MSLYLLKSSIRRKTNAKGFFNSSPNAAYLPGKNAVSEQENIDKSEKKGPPDFSKMSEAEISAYLDAIKPTSPLPLNHSDHPNNGGPTMDERSTVPRISRKPNAGTPEFPNRRPPSSKWN